MVTAKMTVMMVASPPDNELVVDEVFHGDGDDDDDDGYKNEMICVKCEWAIDGGVSRALKLLLSTATAGSLERTRTQTFSTWPEKISLWAFHVNS